MNDNLRYISLQYIKGDNYDNITCFNKDEMGVIFDDADPKADEYDDEVSTKVFIDRLKKCKQEKLCNIGEKLIDDLVNYYQFKYYTTHIKKKKGEIETKIGDVDMEINEKNSELKSKGLNNKMNDKTIIQILELTLKNLINIITKKDELEGKYIDTTTTTADVLKTFNQFKKIVKNANNAINYNLSDDFSMRIQEINDVHDAIKGIDTTNIDEIDDIIKKLKVEINKLNHSSTHIIKRKFNILEILINKPVDDDLQGHQDNKKIAYQKQIYKFKEYVSTEIEGFIIPYLEVLKSLKDVKSGIEKYSLDAQPQQTKDEIRNLMEKVPNNIDVMTLKIDIQTKKDIIEEKQNEYLERIKESENYKSELKKVVDLLSEYYKICDENIKKYEKIFKHNDISSIDDAFMIKSYSDFLKKLNQLKENLESKDKGKIKRAFTDYVKRLLNLYGLNINKKETFEGDNLKFLIDRIVNYV